MAMTSCGAEEPEDDPAVHARPAAVNGTELKFQLPSGGFTLVVGEPITTIPAEDTADGEPIEARDGERFVPVDDVQADGNNLDRMGAGGLPPYPDAQVALRVDDRRYQVSGDTSVLESYIRVKADSDSRIGAEVVFDGVTQVIWTDGQRDTGEAGALYGYPKQAQTELCDDGWVPGPGSRGVSFSTKPYDGWGCDFMAVEYPYIPNLGWSFKKRDGAMWAYVRTNMALGKASVKIGENVRKCEMIGTGTAVVTVDGQPAVERLLDDPSPAAGPAKDQRNIFLVEPLGSHTLRIETSHPCTIAGKLHRVEDRKSVV